MPFVFERVECVSERARAAAGEHGRKPEQGQSYLKFEIESFADSSGGGWLQQQKTPGHEIPLPTILVATGILKS